VTPVELDLAAAHKHFAAACFNATWGLLDKPDRSADDADEMLRLAQVSLWHWTQREDCGPMQLSVGYWLLSRVHAVRAEVGDARQAGERCLAQSVEGDLTPFYRGFGHEALVRAALLAAADSPERTSAAQHLAAARGCLEAIEDAEERSMLEADLVAIEGENRS
jgi:hypothetical protein